MNSPRRRFDMKHTDTVIIGGGQAGLVMSRCLVEYDISHVILERGRVGERWRSERWDSLRLLTPNWQCRLPHFHYGGNHPDAFMTMPEFIRHLERYAESFEAPVQTGTTVRVVERLDNRRFRIATDKGEWSAHNVVVATGFCDTPRVPKFGASIPNDIVQVVPSDYRSPSRVPQGGVLIVGASATGLQIADELAEAGRDVTLAVGTHVRVPRRYRGKDILYWMDAMGAFNAPADPAEERKSPPPQLVGTPENRDLDLGVLRNKGVRLIGRATAVQGDRVYFDDDLKAKVEAADSQMMGLLAKVDGFIESSGAQAPAADRDSITAVKVGTAPTMIDLRSENIRTVVWATGYERLYPWLKVPVLDNWGEIQHDGGVVPEPGLYVLGMRFQRTKGSNLIDYVGRDAEILSKHIAEKLRDKAA
jgi:putative flavoprotein involved in K+ transport